MNRATLLAFIAGAGLSAGVAAFAQGGAEVMHHGMMLSAKSPAEMSAHVDHVLKHMYVEIDATDAQKAQIDPLVHQAMTDMMPLFQQASTRFDQLITDVGAVLTPTQRQALKAHIQKLHGMPAS
jgi:periplasmic protein CpxP/Spy